MLFELIKFFERKVDGVYSVFTKRKLANCGSGVYIGRLAQFIGGQYINVANNVSIGSGTILTAFDSYFEQTFTPEITIGSGTIINPHAHITAIYRIRIGANVLFGNYVTVTDNSHGYNDSIEQLNIPPLLRPVYSKGSVIIEDNVWIGDNAIILPNVTIGKSSIIGAGSVVTKDVPPYSVAVGNPAKIVKTITKYEI